MVRLIKDLMRVIIPSLTMIIPNPNRVFVVLKGNVM